MPSALLSINLPLGSLFITLSSFYYFLSNYSIGKGNLHLSLSRTCFLPWFAFTEPYTTLNMCNEKYLKTLDYFKYVSLVCLCMPRRWESTQAMAYVWKTGTTLWSQFSPPISASVPEMNFRPIGLCPRWQVPLSTELSPSPMNVSRMLFKSCMRLRVMVHVCNPSTWEGEARDLTASLMPTLNTE